MQQKASRNIDILENHDDRRQPPQAVVEETSDVGHLNVLLEPASARLSRFASDAALFAAASSGFALALFSLALIFFSAAFSPDDFGA